MIKFCKFSEIFLAFPEGFHCSSKSDIFLTFVILRYLLVSWEKIDCVMVEIDWTLRNMTRRYWELIVFAGLFVCTWPWPPTCPWLGDGTLWWQSIRYCSPTAHEDVIKWKHFLHYWPFVRGIHQSPVDSPHKGQWHGALVFSLTSTWTNGLANTQDTGDSKHHRAHYDVIVMRQLLNFVHVHAEQISSKYNNVVIFSHSAHYFDVIPELKLIKGTPLRPVNSGCGVSVVFCRKLSGS